MRTKSVPGAYLIGGESRSASQSLSTRTKFGDQQYILVPVEYFGASPILILGERDVPRRRQMTETLVRKSHPNMGDTAGLRAPRPAFAYETGKTIPPPAYQQKPSYEELSVSVCFLL